MKNSWLLYNILYVIENLIKTLFLQIYGGHSAHLILYIIISEFQNIILDCSLKILSGREKYLLGTFIYWARLFILGVFIYSIRLCSLRQTLLDFLSLLQYVCTIPQNNCDITVSMLGSVQLNRRVSRSSLLQQHHPNLTSVGESCILFFFVFGKLTELPN